MTWFGRKPEKPKLVARLRNDVRQVGNLVFDRQGAVLIRHIGTEEVGAWIMHYITSEDCRIPFSLLGPAPTVDVSTGEKWAGAYIFDRYRFRPCRGFGA